MGATLTDKNVSLYFEQDNKSFPFLPTIVILDSQEASTCMLKV